MKYNKNMDRAGELDIAQNLADIEQSKDESSLFETMQQLRCVMSEKCEKNQSLCSHEKTMDAISISQSGSADKIFKVVKMQLIP